MGAPKFLIGNVSKYDEILAVIYFPISWQRRQWDMAGENILQTVKIVGLCEKENTES